MRGPIPAPLRRIYDDIIDDGLRDCWLRYRATADPSTRSFYWGSIQGFECAKRLRSIDDIAAAISRCHKREHGEFIKAVSDPELRAELDAHGTCNENKIDYYRGYMTQLEFLLQQILVFAP